MRVAAVASFFKASSGLSVRVPFLGLGIRPFGPKTRARGISFGMIWGVAIKISKSSLPSWMSLMIESLAMTAFLVLVLR